MVKKTFKIIGALVFLLLIVIGSFRFLNRNTYHIASHSMLPNLEFNQRVKIEPEAYVNSDPQAGDVIVFSEPTTIKAWIARVIGVPGESISFKGGRLSVNGLSVEKESLGEMKFEINGNTRVYQVILESLGSRVHKVMYDPQGAKIKYETSITLEKNEYFVAGDNRDASTDSRTFGTIQKDLILGKAVIP